MWGEDDRFLELALPRFICCKERRRCQLKETPLQDLSTHRMSSRSRLRSKSSEFGRGERQLGA